MIHLDDLLAATRGRLAGAAVVTSFSSFCYDSRLVQPGQLFLAIGTDRAGRRWDSQRKVWSLRHERVIALGLQERVTGRWEGTSHDARPGS
jgi:hypothetical protein